MRLPAWLPSWLPALVVPALPYVVGGAMLVGGALWLRSAIRHDGRDDASVAALTAGIARRDAAIARQDTAIARRDTAIAALLATITQRDAEHAAARRDADRAAHDAAAAIAAALAAPGDPAKAADAIRSCQRALAADSLERTKCDASLSARDKTIDSLRTQVAAVKAQRDSVERQRRDEAARAALQRAGPRLSYFGDAGVRARPFADSDVFAPVLKGGAQLRAFGPVSLVGGAEWQPTVPKSIAVDGTVHIRF